MKNIKIYKVIYVYGKTNHQQWWEDNTEAEVHEYIAHVTGYHGGRQN